MQEWKETTRKDRSKSQTLATKGTQRMRGRRTIKRTPSFLAPVTGSVGMELTVTGNEDG